MNTSRRKFLKILLIGSGAFLAERVLSPLFSMFSDSSAKTNVLNPNKSVFNNFKIIEDEKVLSIYDSSGEEIFQIDKKNS